MSAQTDYRERLRAMSDAELSQECLLRIRAYREELRQANRYQRLPIASVEWHCSEVEFVAADTGRLHLYQQSWDAVTAERESARLGNLQASERLRKRQEEREAREDD